MGMRYWLADVDGRLCVVQSAADYDTPRIVDNYYPTETRSIDAVRYFYDFDEFADRSRWNELLAAVDVSRDFPGYFQCDTPRNRRRMSKPVRVALTNGGQTHPVKTEFRPLKAPACRGGSVTWDNGRWHKYTAKGVHSIVEPSL